MAADRRPHVVAVLAYDRMTMFETGIATEVFGSVWAGCASDSEDGPGDPAAWYELKVCVERRRGVPTQGGGTFSSPFGLADLAAADTIVIPSIADVDAAPSRALVAALRDAQQRGARLVSICSGAFVYAAAGLLDGRRATTHWLYADRLRARYPSVEVDPLPLYVDDGQVLTSAGCSAGLDLCLYLVRLDHGARIANRVARRMVVPPQRAGGQAQFVEAPLGVAPQPDDPVAASLSWAVDHLAEPITLSVLAERAHLSPRSYLRHAVRITGVPPIEWLVHQRVQASLPLLEQQRPVGEVARAVGFQTAVTFRHHFGRIMRTSPSAYRQAYAPDSPAVDQLPASRSTTGAKAAAAFTGTVT